MGKNTKNQTKKKTIKFIASKPKIRFTKRPVKRQTKPVMRETKLREEKPIKFFFDFFYLYIDSFYKFLLFRR